MNKILKIAGFFDLIITYNNSQYYCFSLEKAAQPLTTPKPLRRRVQIRRRKKQPVPLTTLQSVVLVEQLPLSGEAGDGGAKVLKIKTTKIKSFPQNTTIVKRRRKKRPKVVKGASAEGSQEIKGMMGYPKNPYYSVEEEGERRRLKKLANDEEMGGGRMLRGYQRKGGRKTGGGRATLKPKGEFIVYHDKGFTA